MDIIETIKGDKHLLILIVVVLASLGLYYYLHEQILTLLINNLINPIEESFKTVSNTPLEKKLDVLLSQMQTILSKAGEEIKRIQHILLVVSFFFAVATMGLITYATRLYKRDRLLRNNKQAFENDKRIYENGIKKETEGIKKSIKEVENRTMELETEKKVLSGFAVSANLNFFKDKLEELFFGSKNSPILIIGYLGQDVFQLFQKLAKKHNSQLTLIKTKIDQHENKFIPYDDENIETYLTSYKQAFDHICFFKNDIVLHVNDRYIIVPSGNNDVQEMTNYWKTNAIKLSFLVKTDYLANVHHLLSERAINDINIDGYAYKANKSKLWLEKPTEIFKAFPEKAAEYKNEITSHFLEFEKQFSSEAQSIIAVWPLTLYSIDLKLDQDKSIQVWLNDLRLAAGEGKKVDRFLFISGERYYIDGQGWDYRLPRDQSYKDKLFEIVNKYFIGNIPEQYKIYCILCGIDNQKKIHKDILAHFTTDLPSFKKIAESNKLNRFSKLEDELHSNWVMFNCKSYSILQYEEIFDYEKDKSLPVFYYHEEGVINGGQKTCDMALRNPHMLSNRCVRYKIYYETLIEAMKFAASPQYKKENYVFPLTNELFNK